MVSTYQNHKPDVPSHLVSSPLIAGFTSFELNAITINISPFAFTDITNFGEGLRILPTKKPRILAEKNLLKTGKIGYSSKNLGES